jgi:hypothetical protein
MSPLAASLFTLNHVKLTLNECHFFSTVPKSAFDTALLNDLLPDLRLYHMLSVEVSKFYCFVLNSPGLYNLLGLDDKSGRERMNNFFVNLWPRITQRLLAVGGAAHSGASDPLASVFGNAKELGI